MTGHESVGHDEHAAAHHAAAQFKLAQDTHLARYPHHAPTDGGVRAVSRSRPRIGRATRRTWARS